MKGPRVSVVMPVYNGERYLREAIDSILGQTYKDFEFIIVNDGSTDQSESIIQSYNDPRIRYLKNEQNSKICITLNKGLDAAMGEYVVRMDCDDISYPNRIAQQTAFMDKHQDIAVAGSDLIIFGDNVEDHRYESLRSPEMCKMGLIFNSCLAHPSVIIRKSVLDGLNLRYEDEYKGMEDFRLWWQISKDHRITNIPMVLLKYRKHKGQETQNQNEAYLQTFRRFLEERIQDLHITLSNDQLSVLYDYITNRFEQFDSTRLQILIESYSKIVREYPIKSSKELQALKTTLSLSILYTISNSELKTYRWKIIDQIRRQGILPFSMFVKLMISSLLNK